MMARYLKFAESCMIRSKDYIQYWSKREEFDNIYRLIYPFFLGKEQVINYNPDETDRTKISKPCFIDWSKTKSTKEKSRTALNYNDNIRFNYRRNSNVHVAYWGMHNRFLKFVIPVFVFFEFCCNLLDV